MERLLGTASPSSSPPSCLTCATVWPSAACWWPPALAWCDVLAVPTDQALPLVGFLERPSPLPDTHSEHLPEGPASLFFAKPLPCPPSATLVPPMGSRALFSPISLCGPSVLQLPGRAWQRVSVALPLLCPESWPPQVPRTLAPGCSLLPRAFPAPPLPVSSVLALPVKPGVHCGSSPRGWVLRGHEVSPSFPVPSGFLSQLTVWHRGVWTRVLPGWFPVAGCPFLHRDIHIPSTK